MAGYLSKILDATASTKLGQFLMKQVNIALWVLEKPAEYTVTGSGNGVGRMPFIIFWAVYFSLHIFRIVASTIYVHFNKGPVESVDIMKNIVKWRKSWRSIRYKGMRKMRQNRHKSHDRTISDASANESEINTSQPQSSKKRKRDQMMGINLLAHLLNKTFSENDDSDPSFLISRSEMSTNISSNASEGHPSSSKAMSQELQDTLPSYKSGEMDPTTKSTDVTFVSTADSEREDLTTSNSEGDSSAFSNESNKEAKGKQQLNVEKGNQNTKKVGKESLNVPEDALISKLAERLQDGIGKHGKKKKRNFSLSNEESLLRRKPVKASKSQEDISYI
ncbi:hypothetical protein Bhyg_05961 [Pseudolycoriella hygida]|uniref:Uncharacterized protein n=1 Tax=Pseudolycoriella hygida TaxID=35572 RepID=A0A9Q0MZN5_9DIPT|nr:hypothetical protein Bhyg_05961 [Pseudolycoriella hygida]